MYVEASINRKRAGGWVHRLYRDYKGMTSVILQASTVHGSFQKIVTSS